MIRRKKINLRKVCYRTVLLLVVLLLVPLAWAMPRDPDTELTVHHFYVACDQCHLEPARDSSLPVGELFGDQNQMCMQCHPVDATLNHPVGVAVPDPPEDVLPLDQDSNITCVTCHEEKPLYDDGFELRQAKPYFLRLQGSELCGSCHNTMGSDLREQAHWQFAVQAHLNARQLNPESEAAYDADDESSDELVDVESRTCLSCHDDMATSIEHNSMDDFSEHTTRAEHPIGIDYAKIASDNRHDFNYPLLDQTRIRLFSGKLGCGSCHSLYNNKSEFLVINDDVGAMCRDCHIK